MNTQTWKAIPGYEGGYEVSDLGNVRSIPRLSGGPYGLRRMSGRVLVGRAQRSGHLAVSLSSEGRVKEHRAHCLVLLAFVGPRPQGFCTRHLDGNPSNNRLENLRYGTVSQNQKDAYVHGTRPVGENSHLAKLSDADCVRLQALKGAVSSRIAAAQFGLDSGYVRTVWRGEARKHA